MFVLLFVVQKLGEEEMKVTKHNCTVGFKAHGLTPAEKQQSSRKRNIKKVLVLTAATASVVAGLALVGKKQGINPFTKKGYGKLNFDQKSIGTIATLSLLGGLSAGVAYDTKNAKYKIREGIQLFIGNIATPLVAAWGGEKLYEKFGTGIKMPEIKGDTKFIKGFNGALKQLPRAATVLSALVIGLFVGNKLGNLVTGAIFKDNKTRDIQLTDAVTHVDDLSLGASLVAKGTVIDDIAPKLIPPALITVGFLAGTKEKEPKKQKH